MRASRRLLLFFVSRRCASVAVSRVSNCRHLLIDDLFEDARWNFAGAHSRTPADHVGAAPIVIARRFFGNVALVEDAQAVEWDEARQAPDDVSPPGMTKLSDGDVSLDAIGKHAGPRLGSKFLHHDPSFAAADALVARVERNLLAASRDVPTDASFHILHDASVSLSVFLVELAAQPKLTIGLEDPSKLAERQKIGWKGISAGR